MDSKRLAHVEIKDADKGQVSAVFSTLGVKDYDGDVTLPGAFEEGAPVRISAYNHESTTGYAMPVGRGTITTTKDKAVMDGQFFLDTTAGRDTFATIKAMGDLQEWSYGYDVTDSSYGEHNGEKVRFLSGLKVFEVSPVLVGAGIGTRTLSAKAQGLKFPEEAALVLAGVKGLLDRASEIVALRAEKGKGMAGQSVDLLTLVQTDLARLETLLTPEPEQTEDDPVLMAAWLRSIEDRHRSDLIPSRP